MSLVNIFLSNLLPVLLLAGAGFTLGRLLQVNPRPLGQIVFNIFTPILIFDLITRSQLTNGNIVLMVGFSASIMILMAGIAYVIGKIFRLERTILMAIVLSCMVGNNGNFGLPVIAFAFGDEALAYASIYFVTSLIIISSLGIFTASLGHLSAQKAFLALFRVPANYAIVLGIVFINAGWTLPDPLQSTITLASAATVPCMLVLLGLELQRAEWRKNLRILSIPVVIRLVVSPLTALLFASVFGLSVPARQAGITEAGMPSAVMTTVLASEYKLEPSLVTAIVFTTTILSPLTLTPLLFFLS